MSFLQPKQLVLKFSIEATLFKDIMFSVNEVPTMFEFSEKGLTFQSMDAEHLTLVEVVLPKEKFKFFQCPVDTDFGLHVKDLNKFLICAKENHFVHFNYVIGSSQLNVKIVSIKNEFKKEFNLIMKINQNIDYQKLKTSDTNFGFSKKRFSKKFRFWIFKKFCILYEFNIQIGSKEYKQLISSINEISDCVKIEAAKLSVKFKFFDAQIGKGELEHFHSDNIEKIKHGDNVKIFCSGDDETVFEGIFNVEKLSRFSKPERLSKVVTIKLVKKAPLVVEYKLSNSIGFVKYFLAPSTEE